jgi:asparagine synthase (glutamine-hydrolysing)
MIPCFMATISGVSVFFADIRHLLDLHGTFEVNWKYFTAFISWPHLQIRDTALLDVQEVLAGEIVVSSPTRRRTEFAWNPISICESEPLLDAQSARMALLETTQQSVSAWSSVHHRLLHRLSGGFDSAAVLGAIVRAESQPEVVCVNQYGDALAEDERRYARCAARLYDLRLIEIPWDHSGPGFDGRCLAAPITAKPTVPYIVDMLEASFWNDFCQEYECDGITTGQGGDHIFMSPPTIFGVPDCLWLHGLGREFLEALRDATILTGQSLWHVLSSAILVSVNRGRFPHYAKYTPNAHLLCREAIFPQLPHYILPPWCLSSGHLATGKRYQVLTIAEVVNRHRPMPDLRDTEELHPLLSQPLLSTALRIPLHLLYTGGKKRGLARDAFSEYLPQEILTRETKGHTGTYILGLVRKSLPFVRQMLLDGNLVRSGVLSRDILAQYLNPEEPLRAAMIFPILASISAELWILRWFDGVRKRSHAGPNTVSLQFPHLCLTTPDGRWNAQAQPD